MKARIFPDPSVHELWCYADLSIPTDSSLPRGGKGPQPELCLDGTMLQPWTKNPNEKRMAQDNATIVRADACCGLGVITTLEFLEHHFAKVGHRSSPYDPTLSLPLVYSTAADTRHAKASTAKRLRSNRLRGTLGRLGI